MLQVLMGELSDKVCEINDAPTKIWPVEAFWFPQLHSFQPLFVYIILQGML